jgi:hypothetical protein
MRKMIYTKVLEIPKERVKELQKILNRKTAHPDFGRDAVITTFTISFNHLPNKKYEADIKVCNGDSPYVDPVFFEIIDGMGYEIHVGEVSDSLLGEYHFHDGKKEFLLELVQK